MPVQIEIICEDIAATVRNNGGRGGRVASTKSRPRYLREIPDSIAGGWAVIGTNLEMHPQVEDSRTVRTVASLYHDCAIPAAFYTLYIVCNGKGRVRVAATDNATDSCEISASTCEVGTGDTGNMLIP